MFKQRIRRLCSHLKEEGIAAAVLEDKEGCRDANLRYLSGMPSDAVLIIIPGTGEKADKSLLIPWDEILAKKTGHTDEIIPYGAFGRNFLTALESILSREKIPENRPVELPSHMPHPVYKKIIDSSSRTFLCRNDGIDGFLKSERMLKDESEIDLIRQGAGLTNRLLEELEMEIKKQNLQSEIDVALFIERRSRGLGCEGTGFETIAAGPERSWGIHAFPLFTSQPFGTRGFSLVDFGVNYKGYTTDVTASYVKGPLSQKQEKMMSLVTEAYTAAAEMLAPGVTTMAVADRVNDIFEKAGWVMPHSLGHGFGLEVHETPYLRAGKDPVQLKPGMIFTLEPGLYHEKAGGIRWENDFLITETGAECLTTSRIYRLID